MALLVNVYFVECTCILLLGGHECVTEDMNILGIEEYMVQDRQMWRTVIARPTPS